MRQALPFLLGTLGGLLIGTNVETARAEATPSAEVTPPEAPGAAGRGAASRNTPESTLEANRARARSLFARGLALAHEGHYAEAKRDFLNAYRAHPHYEVLYNVAQADVRLGDIASAVVWLERFLSEGSGALDQDERSGVERQLDELRARLLDKAPSMAASAEVGRAAPGADEPSPEAQRQGGAEPLPAARPLSLLDPPPALARPAAPEGALKLEPLTLRERSDRAGASAPSATIEPGRPPWGWILVGTGAALAASAAGLYVWNGGRHERWERERQALDAVEDREQALRTNAQLWNEAKDNNDLLASVQRVDIAAVLLAGAATLAMGAGTWELLARPAMPARATSASTIGWSTRW